VSVAPAPITFTAVGDPAQAPRFIAGRWSATVPLRDLQLTVVPAPAFACRATIDPAGRGGTYGCEGLFPPSVDLRIELAGTTSDGARAAGARAVRTMGDRLTGVPWFTEFEDPNGEALACAAASARIIQAFTTGRDTATAREILERGRPLNRSADPGDPNGEALACAAASARIIQAFTTGRDTATAREILERGRPLNRSADPGIDPAAIAAVITALDAGNRYHYYRFASRDAATRAAVYWLARSAKPVIALSLAGQHAPVITGYAGAIGGLFGDPATITSLVVEDPQRGDLDPATAIHRPDKSRSAAFQTGKAVPIDEWYTDDWWFRDAYKGSIVFNSDAKLHDVDRNDGAYPRPHWDGTFVILVDDGDAENPPDREGQVRTP